MHQTELQNHEKQKLIELKGKINKSTILVGNVNITLSTNDRTIRKKITKGTKELKHAINQYDLINIYVLTTEHIFFSKRRKIYAF